MAQRNKRNAIGKSHFRYRTEDNARVMNSLDYNWIKSNPTKSRWNKIHLSISVKTSNPSPIAIASAHFSHFRDSDHSNRVFFSVHKNVERKYHRFWQCILIIDLGYFNFAPNLYELAATRRTITWSPLSGEIYLNCERCSTHTGTRTYRVYYIITTTIYIRYTLKLI